MFRGFLFNLWRVACLCDHGFESEMCGWGGSPGFVCITQGFAPLLLQPWAGKRRCRGTGRMEDAVGLRDALCAGLWPRVLSLHPWLEREGVHAPAERVPFGAISFLPCKRSDRFHRKAVYVEKHVILRVSASCLSSSLCPVLSCIPPPTKCI